MELTTTALGGRRPQGPGRKIKDNRAAQHELPGFPASIAMRLNEVAASCMREHVKQHGATTLLEDALDWLARSNAYILDWRTADQKRTEYPYKRPAGHA